MHNLPPDAATWRRLNPEAAGWDVGAYLAADLYALWAGEAHPARPQKAAKAARYAALRDRLERQRARHQTEAPATD